MGRSLQIRMPRYWFIHGDLQVDHVFVDGDEVTGVVDWSEASEGDALFDVAILTLGHREHLGDVLAGYGTDLDRDLIRAWWAMRCLINVRWLAEHGYGSPEEVGRAARRWLPLGAPLVSRADRAGLHVSDLAENSTSAGRRISSP